MAAEVEFLQRWDDEKLTIFGHVAAMEDLREFYEKYSSAYGSLVLEVERRRQVDDKIQGIWRKARDSVDKLVEADRRDRDIFRQDAGDYLPTDLWRGMNNPLRRWDVVPLDEEPAKE